MIMWGQSAGANAVVTYSYANPVDPIVKGLVAGSGAAAPSLGVNTTTFSMMAAALGCEVLSAADELSCMQKVDALKIQAYVLEHGGGGFGGIGGMVADNVTAFANNTQRLAEGKIARIVSDAPSLKLPETDTCDSL
jgi:carboxylesterase type B